MPAFSSSKCAARCFFVALGLALAASSLTAQWTNPPRLHNPTFCSVTLSGVAEIDLDVRLAEDPYRVDRVRAGEQWSRVVRAPSEVVIETRPANSGLAWQPNEALSLRPLPGPDAPKVTVAIASDTHAWSLHSKSIASDSPPDFGMPGELPGPLDNASLVTRTMENVAARQPDLLVHNGDFTVTWCAGCQAVGGQAGEGSSATLNDALFRTRTVWGQKYLGKAGTIPALMVMGDHEGLMPWVSVAGTDVEQLGAHSAQALVRTVPIPASASDGSFLRGPTGTLSWALRSADLLVVGLDVHAEMTEKPLAAEDWKLSEEHLAWLGAVLSVDVGHKVVIAEHVLGGISGPANTHWKARSSIKATDDGTVSGSFVGEQAKVHALMQAHGADVFVTGHDHVAAWGAKDGVLYVSGGRAGGIGGNWRDEAWFMEALDYDGDGVPEYDSGITGSREPGHLEIESLAGGALTLRYVGASGDDSENGVVLLELALEP